MAEGSQSAPRPEGAKDIVEGNALTKRRSVPLTIAHRAVYHHGPSAAVLSASFIYRGVREATVRRGSPASRCTKKESGRAEKKWKWGRKRRKDCRTVGKHRGLRIYESQMMRQMGIAHMAKT